MSSRENFVRQQGFYEVPPPSCQLRYPALMWQPRLVLGLALIGIALQAWPWFAGLGALLWWNVLVPRLNPFDHLYNRFVAAPRGIAHLEPAPPPRRTAQGMAGAFMLAIAGALAAGWTRAAWIIEGILLVAVLALVFGRFCLGSWVYLVVSGRSEFARRTMPWSR